MARIERDGTLVLEIAISPDTAWTSAEEMYQAVRDAAEEALVEALGDTELQEYMGMVMGGEGEAGSAEVPEDDGEVGELVKLMN